MPDFVSVVMSITSRKPDETTLVQHCYTNNETNSIIEYWNSIDGQTSYDYDFLSQLIGMDCVNTGLTDESYTYDENGNRVTNNGSNYTTDTNNELTFDATWTYTYDDEGDRISKTNSTNRELYAWDYRNCLAEVAQQRYGTTTEEWQNIPIVEYSYDYNNVWIWRTLDTRGDVAADS